MESTPQAFPNQLASPTPHPNEPNTAFPEPIEFTPQVFSVPLASSTPLPNQFISQASVPPDTSHQTVPPFASTTEGPALTSSLASEVISVTNPSLVSEIRDAQTFSDAHFSFRSVGLWTIRRWKEVKNQKNLW
jgi:hypothetical protein